MFSSKKETIVSSTVYNLAGDEATRPDFIKNSIYGAIMSPFNPFLGETLVRNHLMGPGMNQRRFFKWAVRQDYAGLPTYSVSTTDSVDPAVVAPFIPTPGTPAGLVLSLQTVNMVSGDYEHVVESYVLENFPQNFNTDYISTFDKPNNEITIVWEISGSVTFSAGSYSKDAMYIVGTYYHYLPADLQSLVTGSTTTGDINEPSTAGYGLDSSSNTGIVTYNMNYDERTITTYTGPSPPADTDVTTSESDSVDFNGLDTTHSKVTYEGGDGNDEDVVNREHFLERSEYRQIYQNNTQVSLVVNEDTPDPGVTQTIEVRRINDHLRPIWDWRIDTQDTFLQKIVGGVHIFVYEIGTGNSTLDDLLTDAIVSEADAEYYPYMPIRLDNVSITHADYDDITGSGLYEMTNRAYRRASGGGHRFSRLVDEIEENEQIDDIDFAFTHHGVGLNVLEPACRKYMYTWLKNVSAFQNTSATYMDEYKTQVATYTADKATYDAWIFAQGDPARNGYGDARPDRPQLNDLKYSTVRLKCADSQLENLDMRITWINITETTHSGLAKPDAVIGEIWFEGYPVEDPSGQEDYIWTVFAGLFGATGGITSKEYGIDKQTLYWQTGVNAYKKLTIWGLQHNNLVYNGESVKITPGEALASTDPTGFIIPLHYQSVKDLGIVDATQMATANTFVVFNSYEVVKTRWYEGFIGMLIIFLVIIVITIVMPPLGAGAGAGILGTNAAVGAAMGLTGTAAIVAGAVVNALVAIAISQIVTSASTAIFGDKIGAIVATVINLAISFGVAGGFDFDNLGELMTASNILKITSAIANGYDGYVQGAIAEIGDDLVEDAAEFKKETSEIEKMLRKLRGGENGLNFDPLSLTDSVKGNDLSRPGSGYITETLDEFIHRTTMTGSDIVEVSLSLVNNYADLSLELP